MEIAVPYLILLIAVTVFGSRKNRGLSTFFIALILSPLVGLIWALLVSDPEATKCPMCKEIIQPDAIKCKHCGAGLTHTK